MSLEVDVREVGGEVVVVLEGEMDTHTAKQVGERISRSLDAGAASVVIEGDGLKFLDSSTRRDSDDLA